jgi:hypothetical protein
MRLVIPNIPRYGHATITCLARLVLTYGAVVPQFNMRSSSAVLVGNHPVTYTATTAPITRMRRTGLMKPSDVRICRANQIRTTNSETVDLLLH